jgi:hypothetical protein
VVSLSEVVVGSEEGASHSGVGGSSLRSIESCRGRLGSGSASMVHSSTVLCSN